ncbi:MAG: hypothetical protein KZQ58_08380 [gamma proteobacterium symbiont of Bathyaustriella thionipta]|nr:hypothetical protein [gamma proteobacterium symbiont of Bathyaustriella thionipta]
MLKWPAPNFFFLLLPAFLTACVSNAPRQPANIILDDVHNQGREVEFSADSRYLASAGSEGLLVLWQLQPQVHQQASWKAHENEITGLLFVDGSAVISTSLDGRIKKWSYKGALLHSEDVGSEITNLLRDKATRSFVISLRDGRVQQRALSDLGLLQQRRLRLGEITALAAADNGQQYAAADIYARVVVWDWDLLQRPMNKPSSYARTLLFSDHDQTLLGAGWHQLYRWQVRNGDLQELPTEHAGIIKEIEATQDGRSLLSISRETDSAVLYIDPLSGKTRKRLQSHELCGSAISMSADGRYVATTSDDASVRIWDMHKPLPESRDTGKH